MVSIATFIWRDGHSRFAWLIGSLVPFLAFLRVNGWWMDKSGSWEPQDPVEALTVAAGILLLAAVAVGWRALQFHRALSGGRGEGLVTDRYVTKMGTTLTVRYKAGRRTYDTRHTVNSPPPLPVGAPVTVAFPEGAPEAGWILDAFQ